ncbi:MAG: GMC family oxidoreductase [Candidatus Jettenia caeni]|nr:MAG: GMC family oxidoreductase [Candidatus Jettenia caeni]
MPNLQPKKQTTDIVVIGCGSGGGVIAKELSEAGLSVVVLESGKRFNPLLHYKTYEQNFEVTASEIFQPDNPQRDLYTCEGKRFGYNRVKGVGGSTLRYIGVVPRFHESDFRVRSEDGVSDDWPISYAELEPYYTKVEYELGVSGLDDTLANPFDPPRSKPYPTPPHEFNCASKAVKRGADKLGLHLTPAPLASPTRPWNGRPSCIECGGCMFGCFVTAKSSIDVTYVRKAEATGLVDIRTQSMAREITVRPDGKAHSVIYFDAGGNEQEICASAIVVAGNAVETPRLLLLSKSGLFPEGLANSSGLVGKYFTEHLALFCDGLFSERLDTWRGNPAGGIIQDFYETNKRNNFVRGWTIEVNNGGKWPLSVASKVNGWGKEHKVRMKEVFGYLVGLASIGEQLPDIRNQVTLDHDVKDHVGIPVPKLTNEPRENDRKMMKAILRSFKAVFEASGAREMWEPKMGASAHYLGTCRMGKNPDTSVVDPWCRTHDVPNLFIADSSVFVTGAAVNPALTIMALATRTAKGIIAGFKQGVL